MRRTGMAKLLIRLTAAAGLAGSLVVGGATAASASCALPPQPSPDAFIGTVVDTDLDGRQATVETAEGVTVTVVGTPSPDDRSFTSVDRTYEVGATYEFHPVNGADPYQDNACTATHRLRGDAIPAALLGGQTEAPSPRTPGSDGSQETGSLAGATDSSLPGGAVAVVALVVIALAGLGGGWLWRRSSAG